MLRINAFCTRFERTICRGGDQTLVVRRPLFEALGGYRERFVIMEDYDFIRRARQQARFKIIPDDVVVSARKYTHNSYLRVNLANLVVFTLYRLGVAPPTLRSLYHRLIRPPKHS